MLGVDRCANCGKSEDESDIEGGLWDWYGESRCGECANVQECRACGEIAPCDRDTQCCLHHGRPR